MREIKILLLIAAFLSIQQSMAASLDAPVILVTPNTAEFQSSGAYTGLIPGMIVQSSEKRTGKRIQGFHDAAKDFDLVAAASKEFACIGIPAGTPCRAIRHFSGSDTELGKTLRDEGVNQALVVHLILMHEPRYFRARATLTLVNIEPKETKVEQTTTAVYFAAPPKALLDAAKKSPESLQAYWAQGDEPLLVQEARKSMVDLPAMLTVLFDALPPKAKKPTGWESLQPVKALAATGRIRCGSGTGCSGARVYEDKGDRMWLTMKDANLRYGWPMVSINMNAAQDDSNVLIYLTVHEL
jgi:hypothetical protein